MWLSIEPGEKGSANVVWGANKGPRGNAYRIGIKSLKAAAKNVRARLRDLADWGIDREPETKEKILKELARAGYELYYALFDSTLDRAKAIGARQWVRDKYAKDRTLSIQCHESIHIPWGLVCETNPLTRNPGENIGNFRDFWGLKYSLSATVGGYPNTDEELLREPGRQRLISLVNSTEAAKIKDEIRKEFESFLARPIGRATRSAEMPSMISNARVDGTPQSFDPVLHFFGHQYKGEMRFEVDEAVTVGQYRMLLDDIVTASGGPDASAGLVFISACDGAHGDDDNSFLAASEIPGIYGLISAESAVPRDFAAEFATRFLTELLNRNKSVGEVMSDLRNDEKLWPLSLLYGCYCQPDFKFGAPPKADQLSAVSP